MFLVFFYTCNSCSEGVPAFVTMQRSQCVCVCVMCPTATLHQRQKDETFLRQFFFFFIGSLLYHTDQKFGVTLEMSFSTKSCANITAKRFSNDQLAFEVAKLVNLRYLFAFWNISAHLNLMPQTHFKKFLVTSNFWPVVLSKKNTWVYKLCSFPTMSASRNSSLAILIPQNSRLNARLHKLDQQSLEKKSITWPKGDKACTYFTFRR